jgi:hypothetical protein
MFERPIGWLVAGVAVAVVGPAVIGALTKGGRPVLKSAILSGLTVADRVKEVTSEAREQWSDLVAEVQAERTSQGSSYSSNGSTYEQASHGEVTE